MAPATELARVRFPFGDSRAASIESLDSYIEAAARVMPLRDFVPMGNERQFRCRQSHTQLGSLVLGVGGHTGATAVIEGDQGWATVFLPLLGAARFRVASRAHDAVPGQSLVYLSGESHRAESALFASVVFTLPPRLLAEAAADLAGEPEAVDRYLGDLQHSRQLEVATPLERHLHRLLHTTVGLVEDLPQASGAPHPPVEREAIERLLIRLLALRLHPDLASRSPLPSPRERPRRRRADPRR